MALEFGAIIIIEAVFGKKGAEAARSGHAAGIRPGYHEDDLPLLDFIVGRGAGLRGGYGIATGIAAAEFGEKLACIKRSTGRKCTQSSPVLGPKHFHLILQNL